MFGVRRGRAGKSHNKRTYWPLMIFGRIMYFEKTFQMYFINLALGPQPIMILFCEWVGSHSDYSTGPASTQSKRTNLDYLLFAHSFYSVN